MKIILLLILNSILKVFHPEIFFLAPIFLIFFLNQNKNFFTFFVAGSIIDDFLAIRPLFFTLFISSFSLLVLSALNKLINSNKISGVLLFLFVFLLIYFAAAGFLFNYQNLNFRAFVFLMNMIYGMIVLVIYKIIT